MMKKIFIVSGEESGDLHGAELMRELKKLIPGIVFGGMGGERMRGAGLMGLDSRDVSVVGIVEVLSKLPGIYRTFNALKERLGAGDFDCVVLIDFPDFNLRFAKEAKKLGLPVIYYISPQVWAWRKGRIKKISRLVDKMLVVFPFEKEMYDKEGVACDYVGHPLADKAVCGLSKAEAREFLGIRPDDTVVSLLPGSRAGEVKRMLEPIIEAAAGLDKRLGKRVKYLIPAAGSLSDGVFEKTLKASRVDARILRGKMYEALRASDAAAVASGTATLETALIGTPMVILYRMSPLSYHIGKALIGLKHIGLPNIVAGERVVPELVQSEATPERIAEELYAIVTDDEKRRRILTGYGLIRERLGKGGAAEKSALEISRVINRGV